MINNNFSPIYDSGCCLGRELLDEKVSRMCADKQMLETYVRKGTSEIHWEGKNKKQNHFELIKLLKDQFPEKIKSLIQKVKKNYETKTIKDIINNVDDNLPKNLKSYKLLESRKDLMVKLVTLRLERLMKLE